jgi:acyl-CoA reductase-like NAD-dependent aldehyde dehydrogenase
MNSTRASHNQRWSVTAAQFQRVQSFLSSTKGKVVIGGAVDERQLFIQPTVVVDPPEDDVVLQNEIFGPILPVVRATDMLHAKALVKKIAPESLGLYAFSEDPDEANAFVNSLPNGPSAIDDVMAQIVPTSLPFGGFGQSGFGAYRGMASIDNFPHKQSTVTGSTAAEVEGMLEWRYPCSELPQTVDFIRSNLLAPLP